LKINLLKKKQERANPSREGPLNDASLKIKKDRKNREIFVKEKVGR